MSEKIAPLPEILSRSNDWEVREPDNPNMAYVDLKKKQMVVPMGDSPKEEMIRAHETMHVKITPYEKAVALKKSVGERTLQAMEDFRVWTECNRVGIDAKSVDVASHERELIEKMRAVLMAKGKSEPEI